ncbi:MAG: B12-binding domain-containing protein [Candidatus Hodgkinia cicadicola]
MGLCWQIEFGVINVIETSLMKDIHAVGKLFEKGMFLSQVIKSSRVMRT